MIENIGVTAGKVFEFLKTNGPSPLHHIQKGIGENPAATNQAIGWLAREGKSRLIRARRTGRVTRSASKAAAGVMLFIIGAAGVLRSSKATT